MKLEIEEEAPKPRVAVSNDLIPEESKFVAETNILSHNVSTEKAQTEKRRNLRKFWLCVVLGSVVGGIAAIFHFFTHLDQQEFACTAIMIISFSLAYHSLTELNWFDHLSQLQLSNKMETRSEERLEFEKLLWWPQGLNDFLTKETAVQLTNLLPAVLTPNSTPLLPRQMKLLRHFLRPGSSDTSEEYVNLQIAIISAYRQIGGKVELSLVRSIADWNSISYNLRVVQVAKECVPILKKRVSGERERTQLLRPSMQGEIRSEELLRPAEGAGATPTEELLRPLSDNEIRPGDRD